MNLRQRIVATVLVVFAIPLIITGNAAIQRLSQIAVERNIDALQAAVSRADRQLRAAADEGLVTAQQLADSKPVAAFLQPGLSSRQQRRTTPVLQRSLGEALEVLPDVFTAGVLNQQAILEVAAGDKPLLTALLRSQVREEILAGTVMLPQDCGHAAGPCLLSVAPVEAQHRHPKHGGTVTRTLGYVVTLVQPVSVLPPAADPATAYRGEIVLTRDDGHRWSDVHSEPLPLSSDVILAQESENPYYSFARRSANNLWLAGVISQSDASAVWWIRLLIIGGVFIVLVGVVMVILRSLDLFVFDPLHALQSAAARMAKGDLQTPVRVARADEIGDIAKAMTRLQHTIASNSEEIRALAETDALTGLYNRRMFGQAIEQILGGTIGTGRRHAMLFLDLDHFKQINDTLGHGVGDELLKEVAKRLRTCLHRMKFGIAGTETGPAIARVGGDEFQMLLPDIRSTEDVAVFAGSLLKALREVYVIDGHRLHISSSIGAAIYPDDAGDAQSLLQHADLAMYESKKQGRDSFRFYAEQLNADATQQQQLNNRLREALENRRLELHLQPRLSMVDGSLIGAEALLRWTDEELGQVNPVDLLAVAEERGLMAEITRVTVDRAAAQLAHWQQSGAQHLKLALNVSSLALRETSLSEILGDAMQRYDIDPARLIIELTESCVMECVNAAGDELDSIKKTGVSVALDRFGTGYSSFSLLRRLPIDEIKLDKSFLEELGADETSAAIVRVVAALSRALHMNWTAEGVETPLQLSRLRALGCSAVQGYLFSPALAGDQFDALVAAPETPWRDYWPESAQDQAAMESGLPMAGTL